MTTEIIHAACVSLAQSMLSPEQFGHAVTAEVRDAARKALGRAPVEQAKYLWVVEAKPVAAMAHPQNELIQVADRQLSAAYQAGMDGDEFDMLAAKQAIQDAAPQQPAPAVEPITDDQIVNIANECHAAMPADADEQAEIILIVRECFALQAGEQS